MYQCSEREESSGSRGSKALLATCLIVATGAALVAGSRAVQRRRIEKQNAPLKRGARLVIIGGGFGGLYAARELAALLPDAGDAEITLIDDQNYLLFTPMLTEVAGGELDASDIVHPLQGSAPRVRFVQGHVDAVDAAARRVTYTEPALGDTLPAVQRSIDAEAIILAVGSVSSYHDIPGLQEHSLSMKTLGDAGAIRNRLLRLLTRADQEPQPAARLDLLTVVVGGGGFTGVESMAAINSLLRESAANGFPNVRPEDIRTILVQPEARLLPELSADLAAVAQRELERRGVEVLLNTKVTGAASDYVELEGGRRITTHALIWAGGVAPSPMLKELDCPHGKHGGLVTDDCFRVQDRPGIWAIGDCAEIPNPDGKGTRAPTAQNATREGVHVGHNVVAVLRGEEPHPFRYTPVGELAIVGRHAGVAQVYGVHLTGIAAWAMWRMVYLAKIPDPRQRVRIFANWLLNLAFGRELAEYPS